jgi:chain length determinant protein EpsF
MNPLLLLSALRARWPVFALLFVGTVVSAAAVSLLLPKSYRATATLVVDTREEQSLSNPFTPQRERAAYIQTQVDILTSEKVVRKVIDDLKLAETGWAREQFAKSKSARGSVADWLVDALPKGLKVETSQSSVIHVSFSFDAPDVAARIANGFAKAYLDTVLELRVAPMREAASWFDEQLKSLRVNLERAQARLTEYHQRHGIVAADERLDAEFARLGELSTQLVRAQDQTLEAQARERQARALLARGGALVDRVPDVQAHPHIQRLAADLAQGEARLSELAARYGERHPTYQSQLAETQGRRVQLAAEMRKIVDGLEASTRRARAHEAELRAVLEAQRARVLDLKESRNDLAVLARDVETAQKTYDAALQRFVVSQVESRANQANAALLNPAAVPRKPHRPRLTLNVALAALAGIALGCGAVILLELSDRRVRSFTDLHEVLDVPLLGALGTWNPSARPALPAPQRVARGLPGPG